MQVSPGNIFHAVLRSNLGYLKTFSSPLNRFHSRRHFRPRHLNGRSISKVSIVKWMLNLKGQRYLKLSIVQHVQRILYIFLCINRKDKEVLKFVVAVGRVLKMPLLHTRPHIRKPVLRTQKFSGQNQTFNVNGLSGFRYRRRRAKSSSLSGLRAWWELRVEFGKSLRRDGFGVGRKDNRGYDKFSPWSSRWVSLSSFLYQIAQSVAKTGDISGPAFTCYWLN